ncbi:MJ1477/TM1410 family putative glycoside hydrolase [Maridesulfovibrio sp.]|uniref:MJ1477/TM1410 family putative glycoside hydrolase n=1 Tax=Maridesulfovibrio sp. TaxID=2795000 RepID=UPI002A186F75|nr:MJ1477/TM1410 family putative glycoside hydrolase [Maridesulfovibrio sp.]
MKLHTIVILTFLSIIAACASTTPAPPSSSAAKQSQQETRMTTPHIKINSWAYQLQGPKIATLAESPYDLLVIDYSKDGSDKNRFSAKEISVLHKFNKTVLCYFSIGEAEDYRFYWQKEWKDNPPRFLGEENPDWAGNFKVKYWREDWWEKGLRPYLDRIIEAGFDGVYLDIVDAYWFWHEQGIDVRNTADDMVKLIKRIGDYTRTKAGKNFIICPQNGMGVFKDCSPEYKDVYFKTVDMVGLESLLFNYYSEGDKNYRLQLARELAGAGKTILDVEYIDKSQYADYLKQVKGLDFKLIPYGSTPDAALDGITDFWKFRK